MMGQSSEGVPVVVMRGYKYQKSEERISDYTFSMKAVRKILWAIFYDSSRALGLGRLFKMFVQK
jgi:F420-0:gamma-glutamyl ligase